MTQIQRHFVQVDGRLVHYRRAGSGPVLLALHQSPRDGSEMEPLMRAMAPYATIIAPDNPGFGLSEPLPGLPMDMDAYAHAVERLLLALGVEQAALYGLHTGGAIATRFASLYPARVSGLVVDGFVLSEPAERADMLAHYLPPFAAAWDAAHLAFAWHRIRDQGIFFPWYRREASAHLRRPPPDPARVHLQIMEFLRSGDAHRGAYGAALGYNKRPDFAALRVPALLFCAQDDVLNVYLAKLPPLPDGVQAGTAADRAAAWPVITDFLRQPLPAVAAPAVPGFAARGVTDGIAWRAGGQGAPVLLLHDLGGAGVLMDPPTDGAWLIPDLPGMGDSDSDVDPADIPAVADAMAGLLRARGLTGVTVRGKGYGARIALQMLRRHGHLVAGLAVDPVLMPRPLSMAVMEGGGHLLAAWQQARDHYLFRTGDGVPPDAARLQMETFYWLRAAPVVDRAWQAAADYPLAVSGLSCLD